MPPNTSSDFPVSADRTEEPVRELDASQLGFAYMRELELSQAYVETVPIEEDDPILLSVRQLLDDGYAGVIFTGPPGTGKTYYASQISRKLVDFKNYPERRRFIQFHHSYQYEDFVEGFIPKPDGGFKLKNKHLLEMCDVARDAAPELCVLVVDELSRSDPGRVFGEALTYIEMNKRERKFHLSSGKEVSIPRNLIILATMNPLDRGADQVDAAFERRFAKISMEPSAEELERILDANGMDEDLKQRVVQFFYTLKNHDNPHVEIGHAYFITAKDKESLKRLWDHQLKFHLKRAFQLWGGGYEDVKGMWKQVLPLQENDNSSQAQSIEQDVQENDEEGA